MVNGLVLLWCSFTLLEHSKCFIQHVSFTHIYNSTFFRHCTCIHSIVFLNFLIHLQESQANPFHLVIIGNVCRILKWKMNLVHFAITLQYDKMWNKWSAENTFQTHMSKCFLTFTLRWTHEEELRVLYLAQGYVGQPPIFQLAGDLIYVLSHCHPIKKAWARLQSL